ncbi:MAG: GNAT family N-acetyltransferase [Pirellulales bacterium]
MTGILRLTKRLESPPVLPATPAGYAIRTFREAGDISGWLKLRDRSFARQRESLQSWTERDFDREFLDKPWWRPERMWLAESLLPWFDPWRSEEHPAGEIVGAVALGERPTPEGPLAIVHWLMVAPRARRGGLARALMAHLERAAWDGGAREVGLETLRSWEAAVELYRGMGYGDKPTL